MGKKSFAQGRERYTEAGMPDRGPLIFLTVALAVLSPILIMMAWPFLTSFIIASILAIVIHPAQERLSKRIRRPRLATALMTLAAVLILVALLAFAAFTLTHELTAAYNALNKRSLEEGGWPALVTDTADRVIDALATTIPVNKEAIRTELIERMKAASGYALNNLGAAVGGVTNVAITLVLVTVFLYCLLQYGEEWVRRLAEVVPLPDRSTTSIVNTVRDSVIANVNGVMAVALAQGLLLILGFWLVGVRAPVLWGVAGGFASIIPVIGAPLVWVPVAVAYLFTGAYWKALVLFVWGAIIVGSVDNILRPVVVGARDKQHPILIGLAAIGGTFAFGPLGIFLGPLAVSLASALFKELQVLSPSRQSH